MFLAKREPNAAIAHSIRTCQTRSRAVNVVRTRALVPHKVRGDLVRRITAAYDFTSHTGGVYTGPRNLFTRIQPYNVVSWQGKKPLPRVLTYGGGPIPAVCPEAGCTYALFQDKVKVIVCHPNFMEFRQDRMKEFREKLTYLTSALVKPDRNESELRREWCNWLSKRGHPVDGL